MSCDRLSPLLSVGVFDCIAPFGFPVILQNDSLPILMGHSILRIVLPEHFLVLCAAALRSWGLCAMLLHSRRSRKCLSPCWGAHQDSLPYCLRSISPTHERLCLLWLMMLYYLLHHSVSLVSPTCHCGMDAIRPGLHICVLNLPLDLDLLEFTTLYIYALLR